MPIFKQLKLDNHKESNCSNIICKSPEFKSLNSSCSFNYEINHQFEQYTHRNPFHIHIRQTVKPHNASNVKYHLNNNISSYPVFLILYQLECHKETFKIQTLLKTLNTNDYNNLLLGIIPNLEIILKNSLAIHCLFDIISMFNINQRYTLWKALDAYVHIHRIDTNISKILLKLICIKETKNEEMMIINILKLYFPSLIHIKDGLYIFQTILLSFLDEAKYIVISFIHISFLELSNLVYGVDLIIFLLNHIRKKPSKTKDGFMASIKPKIFHLLVSNEGHRIIIFLVKKYKYEIWTDLKEVIVNNTYTLFKNGFFLKSLREICRNISDHVSKY